MKYFNNGTRRIRELMLKDGHRPCYHFVIPDGDEMLSPNDSNGLFYADEVYHLMYLYRNRDVDGHNWGHMISKDLLHWRHLPDALSVYEGDDGCFSGGAFVDDDKTAYLSFWKLPSKVNHDDFGGVALARSVPPYIKWERIEPIADVSTAQPGIRDAEINGKIMHLGSCDPSNIWKENGRYYMQYGNKPVLDEYGAGEKKSPEYEGGWTELYRSDDLINWDFLHRFYDVECHNRNDDWPDETEDDMCPVFMPLYDAKSNGNKTDKWIQIFISHNKGCQYFIGEYKNERFYPETHGRMSWRDITYFAPEAMIDDKNRLILITWIKDNIEDSLEKFGWRGVYALPRILWLEDNTLRIAPIDELNSLMYNHRTINGENITLSNPESFRIKLGINNPTNENVIRINFGTTGYADIYYSPAKKAIAVDTTHSGTYGEFRGTEYAPFELAPGETLSLDIFYDKSVIEVFANEQQAVCRRVYPDNFNSDNSVTLMGSFSNYKNADIWDMFPCNPY